MLPAKVLRDEKKATLKKSGYGCGLAQLDTTSRARCCPVAQAFQPAVSPTFQSADHARRLENLRYGRLESLRYIVGQ